MPSSLTLPLTMGGLCGIGPVYRTAHRGAVRLMWSDVDLQAGTLTIRRVVAEVENDDPDALMQPDKTGQVKRRRKYALVDTTKSRRERVVALNDAGTDVVKSIPKNGLYVSQGLTADSCGHLYSPIVMPPSFGILTPLYQRISRCNSFLRTKPDTLTPQPCWRVELVFAQCRTSWVTPNYPLPKSTLMWTWRPERIM